MIFVSHSIQKMPSHSDTFKHSKSTFASDIHLQGKLFHPVIEGVCNFSDPLIKEHACLQNPGLELAFVVI